MRSCILIVLVFFLVMSCTNDKTEKKIEFIPSKTMSTVYLIKNAPRKDSVLKAELMTFLEKNYKNKTQNIYFYNYTPETKYFVENEPDYSGGWSGREITDYMEDYFASLQISKCETDSTKLVGELFFYGLKGGADGVGEIDTLIYYCN